MSAPRSFVASAHANREDAEAALRAVEALAGEGVLELVDAAVVVKADSGRIELHQRRELSPGEGAVGGGVIGVVAGIVLGLPFAFPAAGIALGAAAGALDRGIDNTRMRQLGAGLEPGHAALCALVGRADWPAVRDRMAPYAGELLVAELSAEAAAALQTGRAEEPASGAG